MAQRCSRMATQMRRRGTSLLLHAIRMVSADMQAACVP